MAVLIGVASWRRAIFNCEKNCENSLNWIPQNPNKGCKQDGTYSVFAQVAAQLQWINDEIKNAPETCKLKIEKKNDNISRN